MASCNVSKALIVAAVVGGSAQLLFAQCNPTWLPGDGYSTGPNGTIHAMTAWDPDGARPLAEVLIVGGSFRAIGTTPFERIAAWNGDGWQQLGAGPGFMPLALCVYEGELIAGGAVNPRGGSMSSIARWDGSTWRPLGLGVNAQVNSLIVHDGRLFAGGEFTIAGELDVHSIASWNGKDWEDVGGGVTGAFVPMVLSLASLGEDLVAGGFFTAAGGHPVLHIARWNGTQWHSMGEGRTNGVAAVGVFNGEFIAGANDQATHIARWDGNTWLSLGEGLDRQPRALTTYRGTLIAGGDFTTAGGVQASGVARWDGNQWRPLGAGVGSSFAPPLVMALAPYADKLGVGGFFESAGNAPSVFFARWTDGADYNLDAAANSQDFFDFLADFFDAADRADFNADGVITSQDFFDFLAALFGGC